MCMYDIACSVAPLIHVNKVIAQFIHTFLFSLKKKLQAERKHCN